MLQTFEATVDENGEIRLTEPVKLPVGYKLLVTVLDASSMSVPETALLSEDALAKEWLNDEEDEAWEHLQESQ